MNLLMHNFVQINNHIIRNKNQCILCKNKMTHLFLLTLIKFNLIKSFKDYKTKFILVHFKFNLNKNTLKRIKLFYKPSRKIIVSVKNLIKLSSSKNQALYVLYTDKGVLGSYEALRCKKGGLILCKILL